MSNKFEQLLDYIINEEQDKAKELFHEIIVDKSREIYEGLIDEQDLEAIEEEIEEQFPITKLKILLTILKATKKVCH